MTVAIFLLIIFSVLLLCINYKSRYIWLFILIALSIDCFLISIALFQGKVINYRGIWHMDQKAYIWINSLKIGFYEIVNLYNTGVFLYMLSMCGFINYLRFKSVKKQVRTIRFVLLLIPAVGFLILNSSQAGRSLHVWIHTTGVQNYASIVYVLWELARWINYIVLILYLIIPIICAFKEYKSTRILYNKRKMLVMAIVLCFMDIFFVYMLYHASFRFSLLDLKNLLKFQNVYQMYSTTLYVGVPFVVFILFQGSIFLFMHFRVLERVDFFRKMTISKKNKLLFEDIRPILHSYKNMLLSMNFLAKSVVDDFGKEEALSDAKEIVKMSDDGCRMLTNLLDIFNSSNINVDELDLMSCIDEAMGRALPGREIEVNIDSSANKVMILGDKFHIVGMFENMLYNSIEATENTEAPRIDISITCEHEWNCISIRDNGCGIKKKNIKKIFRPLYSTKHSSKSWGIGLSYVYKVLQAHNGLVFVSSVPNKYTEFQILLPNMKEIDFDE